MSDREFDNYLAILASLLRLSPRQRRAIAEELRAHLEDRLEELTAQGTSHDEAVRQALAEFGDAAGLAGQFGAISLARRRRWLMRLTTFSIAATVLMAAGLAVLWPGRPAGPGVAKLIAQAPEANDSFTAPGSKTSAEPRGTIGVTSAAMRIEAALEKTTNVEVVEMPLKDVVLYLQDTHGIPIYLKKKKLEEAGVAPDHAVTLSLRGVPLITALDTILGELELTYKVGDLLIITTPEDAESQLDTRVYDCRDLLAMPAPVIPASAIAPASVPPAAATARPPQATATEPASSPGNAPTAARRGGMNDGASQLAQPPLTEADKRTGQLIELTKSVVAPDSWDDVGGPGSVDYYNGLVVVSQTYEVHKKVEHLFNMLRRAAGLEVSQGKVFR